MSSGTGWGGGRAGAIACVEIAGDVEGALAALGVKSVGVGEVRRRSVPVGQGTTDDAVVARWTVDRATVMTHAGRAVIEGLLAACDRAGVEQGEGVSRDFVEAADEVEALMLDALARAQSPLAIDLLLDQPRRWRAVGAARSAFASRRGSGERSERDVALCRLIEPALVVAVGPPNIGKSSLLNALAGRGVSVVADQPGTTRDHVGTLIDLGGVVVRWVDTPGLTESGRTGEGLSGSREELIQSEAQRLAREVALRADVLVVGRDAGHALAATPETGGAVVRVGLRADLGMVSGVDASVTLRDRGAGEGGERGLEQLVGVVREAVVPQRWIDDGEPWVFW